MASSDIPLTEELQEDRGELMRRMYQKHWRKVIDYIQKNGGGKNDGEDVFQDSLTIFIQQAQKKEISPDMMDGYFFGICKNVWRTTRKRRANLFPMPEVIQNSNEEEEQELYERLLFFKRKEAVRRNLEKLDRNCRDLLYLWFWEKTPHKEIAKEFRLKYESVKVTISRCKYKLKKICVTDPDFGLLI